MTDHTGWDEAEVLAEALRTGKDTKEQRGRVAELLDDDDPIDTHRS